MVLIKLDTINFKIPNEVISSFNTNHTEVKSIQDSQKGLSHFISANGQHGIGRTEINHDLGITKFICSAKILLDNYLQGISIDTVNQVVENYNKVSPLKLNVNSFIESANLLRCDSTENIKPSYKLVDVRDSMLMAKTNPNYQVKQYNGRSLGIEIVGSIKTEKRRMIGYDKYMDLQLTGKNPFLKSCKNPMMLLNDSKGLWRMEVNHTSFKSIRNRFGLKEKGAPKLLAVLNSAAKPNFDFYKNVLSDQRQLDLFGSLKGQKLLKIEKRYGRIQIVKEFNYDIELIRVFIKSKVRGDVSKYIREYRELIRELKNTELIESKPNLMYSDSIIYEITELLRVA